MLFCFSTPDSCRYVTIGDEFDTLCTMASVGILSEYQPDEDWEDFADRLEQYFITNKMAAAEEADRRSNSKYARMKTCRDTILPDEGPHFPL